ncbi:MAG: DUF4388 domain-containing protein [Acidobacteriota bacterium]
MKKPLPIREDGAILVPREVVEDIFGKAREAVLHVRSGCLVLSPVYVDIESGQIPGLLEGYFKFQHLDRILERSFAREAEESVQFEGDLSVLSLSDVLLFLSASKKTGMLEMQGEDRWGLFFENGSLVYAAGEDARFGLAAHLLRRLFVTEQDLAEGLQARKDDEGMLESLFHVSGLNRDEFLAEWVKSVESVIFHVFTLPAGRFRFHNGKIKPPFSLALSMTTTNYVMEAARRIDEWARLKDRLPNEDAVLKLVEDVTASTQLTLEEEQILSQVDGERSVGEVLTRAKVGDLEGRKAVVSLLAAGLIKTRSAAAGKGPEKVLPEEEKARLRPRIDAYNNVFSTIYQALKVEVGTKTEAILSAFFKGLEPGASILSGLNLDEQGMLPVDAVLSGLADEQAEEREERMVRDLNELLYFQLFAVKNTLGPEMEAGIVEMARTLLHQT